MKATPRAEQLRSEVRTWLKDNPPPAAAAELDLSTFIATARQWQGTLSAAKLLAVHWPTAYGGRSLGLIEEAIIQEELGRAGAPQVLGLFGLTMVGPILIQYGTEQQKNRYLARILSAEEIWCQGFSEPEAGSDLANVKTKAVPVEGGFLLSGQKIWTSFAQVADFIFVLARTTEAPKKHDGLTYFLVSMKTPGITVRPLKQITGDAEFNEVFFDQVFVSADQIVGSIDRGWDIAIATLMYERLILTFSRHVQSEKVLRYLSDEQDRWSSKDKVNLAEALISFAAVRALAYKHLHIYSNGKQPGAEGSLDKLLWSTHFQEIASLALDLEPASHEAMQRYLYSRGRTIAAGTSEVLKNIVAQRLLGLPRS